MASLTCFLFRRTEALTYEMPKKEVRRPAFPSVLSDKKRGHLHSDLSTSDALWKLGNSSVIPVSHNLISVISKAISRLVRIVTQRKRQEQIFFPFCIGVGVTE